LRAPHMQTLRVAHVARCRAALPPRRIQECRMAAHLRRCFRIRDAGSTARYHFSYASRRGCKNDRPPMADRPFKPAPRRDCCSLTPVRDLRLRIGARRGGHVAGCGGSCGEGLRPRSAGLLPHRRMGLSVARAVIEFLSTWRTRRSGASRGSGTNLETPREISSTPPDSGTRVQLRLTCIYTRPSGVAMFGPFGDHYRDEYTRCRFSRNFVRHLPGWYAQKHPDEELRRDLRGVGSRRAATGGGGTTGRPALAKLEYVDRLARELADQAPRGRARADDWTGGGDAPSRWASCSIARTPATEAASRPPSTTTCGHFLPGPRRRVCARPRRSSGSTASAHGQDRVLDPGVRRPVVPRW